MNHPADPNRDRRAIPSASTPVPAERGLRLAGPQGGFAAERPRSDRPPREINVRDIVGPVPTTGPGASYRTAGAAPYHETATGPVLGLPAEQADILLPADLLHGGELILLLLKPSAWHILLGSLGGLGAIAAITAALLALRQGLNIGSFDVAHLLSLAFTLAGLRLSWQFFEWLSRSYVLTDRRVIRVKGVLRVEVFQTRLEHIQHIEMHFSIRERLFGLGSIAFATSGSAYPEAYWVMLRHPLAVHKRIVDAINRYGGRLRMN